MAIGVRCSRVILLLLLLTRWCCYILEGDYTFDVFSGVYARLFPVYECAYVRGRWWRRHNSRSKGAASGPHMTSHRRQHVVHWEAQRRGRNMALLCTYRCVWQHRRAIISSNQKMDWSVDSRALMTTRSRSELAPLWTGDEMS